MVEAAPEQCASVGHPLCFPADLTVDLLHGVGSKVGEASILEIGPDLLHGIEVGSVRREPVDVPARVGGEILAYVAMRMRSSFIPQEDHWPPVVAAEVPKAVEDLRAADIRLGMKRQVEGEAAPPGGHHERTEPRDLIARPGAQGQRRRDAAAPPCATDHGGHQKARLIQADQPGAQARQFFLMRTQSCCSQ